MKAISVQVMLRHPSGLIAIRRVRAFPEFGGLEYTVRFKNDGATELPPLTDLQALDLTFDRPEQAADALVTCGGGGADARYPPKDFAVTRTALTPGQPAVALVASGGKPSAVQLPFWFVENHAQDAGLFVGIGWTGQWQATVRSDPSRHTLNIRAGIPDLDLRLRPGEEISGPTILLGGYRGPLANGTNALRRLIRDRYAPTIGGQPVTAPVLYPTWFDIGAELDEKLARTLIDRAAEIGQEVFLFDAGWYQGTPSVRYQDMRSTWEAISQSLGNWEQGEERSRFPGGLKPLADHIRARGMKLGLWFEPERSGPQSLLAREHPDWGVATEKRKWLVVDLGRPAVQEYFSGSLDGMAVPQSPHPRRFCASLPPPVARRTPHVCTPRTRLESPVSIHRSVHPRELRDGRRPAEFRRSAVRTADAALASTLVRSQAVNSENDRDEDRCVRIARQ